MATAIQTQAWKKITAYIPTGSGTAPTASLYAAAGVAGVTSANLAWVNASIIGTTLANNYTTDTTAVAGIVTSVKKLQGLANGALADVAANNLTTTDFDNLKITGTSNFSATQLSLVNSLLGAKTASQLTNAAAVQAVVNALSHVFSATTASPDAALVVADFAAVGIKGVSANNFETVKAAMSANGTGKTTITEFQDIVTKANTALSVVMGYANGYNATDTAQTSGSASYTTPTAAHYQAIGITLTAAEATLLNSALATKGVIGTEVDTKAKLVTILDSVKAIAAEVGDVDAATGEPGTTHTDPTATDYQNVGLEDISTAVHARILNSFLDNQRIGDKVKIYSTGDVVAGEVVTTGADAVEVLNTLTDVRVLLEETTAIKKFLAYAAGANNGLNFSDFHQLGISTKDKDLAYSLANIRAQYAIDNAADSTNPFVNMDTVAEIQFLLQGVASHIDRVTSSIAIANIGNDSLLSPNNGAITFTVHFSKQLANAATALDATGANFELVLSDGTKLTAGKDFFAEVTLDATDATKQTYTLAVSLQTPVDDAAVTLRYLAKPSAAAAVRDVENVVTIDHTAFADESVNTSVFKQSIDTNIPDAKVPLTLTDAGTDTILSGAAQGVGLVSAAEKADTAATFTVGHAADTTQVEFLSSDGTTVLATANAANNWGITLNLSTLNANLDATTGTGSYQFVTRETDNAGNMVHSTYDLSFDTLAEIPLVVSGITPIIANPDYTVKNGAEVLTISGSAGEEGTVTVVWDQGANGSAEFTRSYTVTSADLGSTNGWSVDFSKSDLLSKGGTGQFTVTFTDLVGNSTTAKHYSTTVDTGLVYNIAAGFGPALSTNDMEVILYKANGTQLGKATYDATTNKWSYTDITRYSGVVLAVLSDTTTTTPDYRDEATKLNKDLASPMVSVFNVDGTSSTAISANVTALTDLAAKKMGGGVNINGASPGNNSAITQADVTQADAAVAKLFGIDITGTTLAAKAPSFTVNVGGSDTSSTADVYGLALAAISKAEQTTNKTTAQIVADLAAALTISAGVPTVDSSAAITTTMTTAISNVMAAASAAAAVENSLQNGFVHSYDNTAPTLTITSDKSVLKANGTATLTFRFSEAVKGFDASDITATLGTITGLAVSADPTVYTATFTAGAVEGNVSVTVAANAYTDMGGNNGSAGASPTLAVDNTAPTLSSTTAPSYTLTTLKGTGGNSLDETIVLTVTFDSAVNGLTTGADSTIFTVAGTGVSATWAGTNGTDTRTLTYKVATGQNGQAAINETALKTVLGAASITDLAGNAYSYSGTIANIDATALPVIDTTAPTITSAATQTVTDLSGIAAGTTVYDAISNYGTEVPTYTLSGADAALFDISRSGAVSFKATQTFAAPKDAGTDNVYNFTVTATDAAGNAATKDVALTMVKGNVYASTALAKEYVAGGYGDTTANEADVPFNTHLNESVTTVASTSKDGTLNGSNALTQYIDRVTGTDIVSDAEFDAGFTITGKAAANAAGTIKFYLDNDRTTGTDEMGAQLVSGTNGVTINYDNSTGNYTISFAGSSAALKQATHGTAGSGVHKLTVDTNGDDLRSGSAANVEASRLFLVASGTAGPTSYDKAGNKINANTDLGANFSVQDTISKNVFVYFNGDVDSSGVGFMTQLDSGEVDSYGVTNSAKDQANRDADPSGWGDGDLYNRTGVTLGTQATIDNTALGFVTNLSAKTYEFSVAQVGSTASNWSTAQDAAGNHTTTNSNTSRMMSAEELLALHTANFGGTDRSNTSLPGAIQPNTNAIEWGIPAAQAEENNAPTGWFTSYWSGSTSPSGHIYMSLFHGYTVDSIDVSSVYTAAVL